MATVSVRRSSMVLAAVGLVFIVVAGLVRFIAVPLAVKLPGDTDATVHYAGTATLLNSKALLAGDITHVLTANVPITVDRRIQVTATHGNTAIVKDSVTVHAGGLSEPSAHVYALDRTSMKGAAPPGGISVEPSRGALSSAFPINPKSGATYNFYDSTTRTIVPVRYTGTDNRHGRPVKVYEISASGPVKDPTMLAPLPSGLPTALMAGLAQVLPPAARAGLTPQTVAALPTTIPLTYTGITKITAYVDRQTGVSIEQTISQQVIANAVLGAKPVALLAVSAFEFSSTPASMLDITRKAKSAGQQLNLLSNVAPLTLLVVGALLLVVAVLLRRRPAAPAPATGLPDSTH
jgi:hypothetical protein